MVLDSKAGLRLMEASWVNESSGFPLLDGRLWLTSWGELDHKISPGPVRGHTICTYPIHSSGGSKPAGLHTSGESRSLSNSPAWYGRDMVQVSLEFLGILYMYVACSTDCRFSVYDSGLGRVAGATWLHGLAMTSKQGVE